MAERDYERLTRSGPRSAFEIIRIARASLWLGKDHVLCVETSGYSYTESYKRFYFRDIQAIIIRKNSARMIRSFALGGLALLFLVIVLAVSSTDAPAFGTLAVFLSLATLSILGVIINSLLGPTCACQIRTAVQTESLPLIRTRRAQKFLERIRPLIAAAQGQLMAEEITARMRELTAGGGASAHEPVSAVQRESTNVQGTEARSGENQNNLSGRGDQEIGAPGQDALPGAIESHGRDARATTDSDAPPRAVS